VLGKGLACAGTPFHHVRRLNSCDVPGRRKPPGTTGDGSSKTVQFSSLARAQTASSHQFLLNNSKPPQGAPLRGVWQVQWSWVPWKLGCSSHSSAISTRLLLRLESASACSCTSLSCSACHAQPSGSALSSATARSAQTSQSAQMNTTGRRQQSRCHPHAASSCC
jgi:hypothetical protein